VDPDAFRLYLSEHMITEELTIPAIAERNNGASSKPVCCDDKNAITDTSRAYRAFSKPEAPQTAKPVSPAEIDKEQATSQAGRTRTANGRSG